MTASRRLETLGIMPRHVTLDLGLEEQDELGHIPWLGTRAEPAQGLPASGVDAAPTPRRERPALRLVAG